MRAVTGFVLAAMMAGPTMAQVETQVDSPPDWLRKPSPADLLAAWPKEALEKADDGTGVVRCKVSAQGGLFDCAVLSEKPEGSGFGSAALALTPQFLMRPAMKYGKPVAYDAVTIPVTFSHRGVSASSARGPLTPVVSNIVWREAPTYAEVAAAFPETARKKGVGGQATIACVFKSDGAMRECKVLGETPFGMGFGPAARVLASRFVGPTQITEDEGIGRAVTQISFAFPAEMLSGGEPVIGKPRWTAVPTAEELKNAIPAGAAAAGVKTARVLLGCRIVAGGALDGCAVENEEPAGQGFGSAALGLSKSFRLGLWTAEGLPTVGGKVNIPLRFEVPQVAAAR